MGVGDDQARIHGQNVLRKSRRHGEIEPVAEIGIFVPFAVGAEILDRRFDLDEQKPALAVQAGHVDATA